MVSIYADTGALLRRVLHPVICEVPDDKPDGRRALDNLCGDPWHTGRVRARALQAARQTRSALIVVDSVDSYVSADRDCGSSVSDDARSSFAQHDRIARYRLHRAESPIRGLDDERLFSRTPS